MRTLLIVSLVGLITAPALSAAPAAKHPAQDPPRAAHAAPPERPQPLTADQIAAIRQIAQQPEFNISPDTRATFSEEADIQITASDISAIGVYATWFSVVGFMLITGL